MNSSDKVVIAGGTGFLGLNLARHLAGSGYKVILLSRHAPVDDPRWSHYEWDGRRVGEWGKQIEGAAALVNLAGRSVDCVKSPDHCDEILRSRVEATRALGLAVRNVEVPPRVWVQMSTAHLYGDPPEVECNEDSAFGYGLAPFVGRAWEEEFKRAVLPEIRQVVLRTSFVLGRSGGALPRLAKLARWRLGGKVGHGRQGISWIHEQDMNLLMVHPPVGTDGLSCPAGRFGHGGRGLRRREFVVVFACRRPRVLGPSLWKRRRPQEANTSGAARPWCYSASR